MPVSDTMIQPCLLCSTSVPVNRTDWEQTDSPFALCDDHRTRVHSGEIPWPVVQQTYARRNAASSPGATHAPAIQASALATERDALAGTAAGAVTGFAATAAVCWGKRVGVAVAGRAVGVPLTTILGPWGMVCGALIGWWIASKRR